MNLTHLILFNFWEGASESVGGIVVPLIDEYHLQGGLQPLDGGLD